MSILIRFVRRHWLYILPVLLLLIFVGTNLDRNYYFGGDLVYPINPQNSFIKSLYLWEGQNGGGSFFKYVLILWQGFFYVLSLVQIPIDIVIKIFITTIYFLGFIFSYLFYRTLFKDSQWGTKNLALIFALFFLLNPAAILVVVGTLELYAVPICAYFLVKYLDTKKILYIIPFSFFLNISFFPGLPQAKPLVVFIIAIFFIIIIYTLVRNLKIKSLILPLIFLTVITFLLNAFVLIPYINDMFGDKSLYQYFTSSVITYNGDADLYSAAIPFTTRFYNSNLVDKYSDLGHFLANPFFISWTFFVLLLSLSSVFFTQDKKEKKLIYISLFAFLVFIFIAKGANPPFGEIYRWSLSHIPIAKLFRTSSTSIIGAVVFYIFLLTISIYFISRKWKVILPIIVILNIIMLPGIYLGYKVKNVYVTYQKGIIIPNEYFEMGKILDNLKKEGKVLVLPLNDGYIGKNWGYTGQALTPWITKKSVISSVLPTTGNLDARTFDELCSFTSLYNIRYFLQEKDTRGAEIKKDINFQGKYLMENNYFKLQETNETCFLPEFYSSENTIYFNGPVQNITNLSYLPIYNKNSIIFTPDYSIKKVRDEKQLINKVKNFVIETIPSNVDTYFTKRKYINLTLGESQLIGDVIYPYVSISPDSIFYPFVLWKEDNSLKKQKKPTRALLDLELFFASKKIKEISIWGVGSDSWYKTQTLFKSYMEKAIQTAIASDKRTENLELTYEYLQGFKRTINQNIEASLYWNKEKINSWKKLFAELENQMKKVYVISDFNNLSYHFTVPSPGDYQGFTLLDDSRYLRDDSVKMNVLQDNNHIATYSAKEIENNRIVELGHLKISSQKNAMIMHISNKENLIDISRWNAVGQVQSVTITSGGILFSPVLKTTSQGIYSDPVINQEIKKWIPGATYLLKIKHKEQEGADLRLRILEKGQKYNYKTDSWDIANLNSIDVNINSKENGNEFKVLVMADNNATGASIYLSGKDGTTKIESITMERVIIPKIYLINENKNQQTSIKQQLTVNFIKVDPTKHIVTINNMTNPSFLVFSETFDKGWKIYGKDNTYLPETQHFLVNGYANAWLIDPQNTKGDGPNQLTIEYIPQRFFYVGTIISIISLFSYVLYSLFAYYNKKRYNKLQNR